MTEQETKNINTQAYDYDLPPEVDAPFWADDETEEVIDKVTFSASADQTTGTAKVDVTKSGYNVNFAFSGIKGEQGDKGDKGDTGAEGPQGPKGDTGETGATGATGPEGPQGPQGEKGADGTSPAVVSTGSSESGAVAGTITGADGAVISVYNGAKGETGPQGPQGETGPQGPSGTATGAVTNVSVTNTNGVYDIKQTIDGTESEVGQISVPSTDNLLAEVTDSVVENTSTGYDFHTIKETENNGTQNDVGRFYIARNQITGLNNDGSFTTVDQAGNEGSGSINIPSSRQSHNISGTIYDALSEIKNNNYIHSGESIACTLVNTFSMALNTSSTTRTFTGYNVTAGTSTSGSGGSFISQIEVANGKSPSIAISRPSANQFYIYSPVATITTGGGATVYGPLTIYSTITTATTASNIDINTSTSYFVGVNDSNLYVVVSGSGVLKLNNEDTYLSIRLYV